MSKTLIETVNARIDELIAARDAEIAAAEQAVAEAKAAVTAAQNAQDTAIASTDLDAYAAAHEDEERAKMAVTVYTARLEQLKNKEFLDSAEDVRIINEIQAYQKKLQDDAAAAIMSHISQLEEIGKAYYAAQDEANALYLRWFNSVSPSIDRDELDDRELRGAFRAIVTNWFYRDQLGLGSYSTGKFWTK